MDFKGLRVLVLDGYGKQLGIILESLHRMGCISTTVNCSKLDVGYVSRYPAKKFIVPEAEFDRKVLEQFLDKEIPSGNYDVVFPMLELATDIITEKREYYSQFVKIIAAPHDAFVLAYNKQETMRICQEIGIPCPKTRMDVEDLEAFLDTVDFPIAIKPRKGTGSIGFKRIASKAEMMKLVEDGTLDPDEYIIQECVLDFEYKFLANIFLDENGEVKSALATEINRWYPIDSGPACYMRSVDRKDVIEYGVKLLQAMNWRGFGQVCYMLDPKDNTPKILEINGRVPASIKINVVCGIDIVRQMLELAFNQPVTEYKTDKFDYRVRQGQKDLLWFIQSPKRFHAHPSWFDRRRTKDVLFTLKDPLPYFAFGLQHLISYKSDMKQRER